MIRVAGVMFACLLAPPALAQSSFVEIAECGLYPISTEGGCSPAEAAEALSGIEPAWGYRLRDSAGVEAYALVSVLGELHEGFRLWASGNCDQAQTAAYSASEIWAWYIQPGPNMNEQGAIDLAAMTNFTEKAIAFLSDPENGSCP